MIKAAGKFTHFFTGLALLALLGVNPVSAQNSPTDTAAAAPLDQHLTVENAEPYSEEGEPQNRVATPTDAKASSIAAPPVNYMRERKSAPAGLPNASSPKGNSGANLMNLVLGLALIIGLIFALSWLVRRMGQGGLLSSNQIKIVAAMPLGTRERIAVIEVGGQQLLLGITATQINTLHVFSEPVIESSQASAQSEFSKKLMTILQQKSLHQPVVNSTTEPRNS